MRARLFAVLVGVAFLWSLECAAGSQPTAAPRRVNTFAPSPTEAPSPTNAPSPTEAPSHSPTRSPSATPPPKSQWSVWGQWVMLAMFTGVGEVALAVAFLVLYGLCLALVAAYNSARPPRMCVRALDAFKPLAKRLGLDRCACKFRCFFGSCFSQGKKIVADYRVPEDSPHAAVSPRQASVPSGAGQPPLPSPGAHGEVVEV